MLSLLRDAAAFFWRRAEPCAGPRAGKDCEAIRDTEGVVTRFCNDYGMINDQIYFTRDAVIGREPLNIGQKVNVSYEEDKTSGGWRAITRSIDGKMLNMQPAAS